MLIDSGTMDGDWSLAAHAFEVAGFVFVEDYVLF